MGPCAGLLAGLRAVLAFIVSALDYVYAAKLPHAHRLRKAKSGLDKVVMCALQARGKVSREMLWTPLSQGSFAYPSCTAACRQVPPCHGLPEQAAAVHG